jgi:hypothetical protein
MVLSLAFFIPSIISWLNERLQRENLNIEKRLIRYTIHMGDNFPTRRRRLLAFSFDSIKLGSLSTSF